MIKISFYLFDIIQAMNIAVDIDDVIADLINNLILFHNETYGTNLQKKDFTTQMYNEVWGGTLPQAIEKVSKFSKTDYFKKITPIPNSLEAVNFLKKNNHTLFLITGRKDSLTEETALWVEKHFPNIFSGIYHTNHYTLNSKKLKKSQVCNDLNIKLIIEDDPTHIVDCANAGIQVFVFDHPWNQGELPKNATRVYSWTEIIENINRF